MAREATMPPEEIRGLFSEGPKPTPFDAYIEECLARGTRMDDLVLVAPRAVGPLPLEVRTRYGSLRAIQSEKVAAVYLINLRERNEAFRGVVRTDSPTSPSPQRRLPG